MPPRTAIAYAPLFPWVPAPWYQKAELYCWTWYNTGGWLAMEIDHIPVAIIGEFFGIAGLKSDQAKKNLEI